MQLAAVLYPGFTALDMVGPFEVLSFVPGVEPVLVADRAGPVPSEHPGLVVNATATWAQVAEPDIVLVPGGPGQNQQMEDGSLHQWLRSVDGTAQWMTSVCTGSLILAAAGLLRTRRATSHWLAVDQLAGLGAVPTTGRVVRDDRYVTAAGVSAGIDMALMLTSWIAGPQAAQSRQLSIEYDPQPAFDAGSPATAPAAVVDDLLRRRDEVLGGDGAWR